MRGIAPHSRPSKADDMRSDLRLGDCLDVCRRMKSRVADLVYVDPPFFTQKTHSLVARDRQTTYAFDDQWDSLTAYLDFLALRLKEFQRILRPTGSIFFHCDSNASHRIRSLMDDVFGAGMFRAEIIWRYRRWSNSQRAPIPSHQTIFFYSRTESYKYHQLFEDYSPSTNVDQILQRRERDEHGKSVYARDECGSVVIDGYKKGVPIGDVWDIPFLNPKASERVGYPTQKPILLLERMISLTTDPGDMVVDPFCGSGATLVAAKLLSRRSLGIDVQPDAVRLAKERLRAPKKTRSALLEKGRDAYRQADLASLAVLQGLEIAPVQRNRGIDAIVRCGPGVGPVLVRVQRKGERLADAAQQLHRAARKKNAVMLFLASINDGGPDERFVPLPPNVVVVESAGKQIRDILHERLLSENLRRPSAKPSKRNRRA